MQHRTRTPLTLLLCSIAIWSQAAISNENSSPSEESFAYLYDEQDEAYEEICDRLPIQDPPQWQVWGATIGSHVYTTCLSMQSWFGKAHRWVLTQWHALTLSVNRMKQSLITQKERSPSASQSEA